MNVQHTLSDRYHYGLSLNWHGGSSPEAKGYEHASRERRIERILTEQLIAQRDSAAEFRNSSLEAAGTICASIEAQTDRLEEAISRGASRVVDAIEESTLEICNGLAAIEWQQQQTNEKLTQILHTLRENRPNEARQLVSQGVRHLIYGEIQEAEGRFILALDSDSTDYQVLLNLGNIEVEKDQYETARRYFNKALNLPEKLDSAAKTIALKCLARLEYAALNFDEAYRLQQMAIKLKSEAKTIYVCGVYAAHQGQRLVAQQLLEQAITLDPQFFSLASSDRDLEAHHELVHELLNRLAIQAIDRFKNLRLSLQNQLTQLQNMYPDSGPVSKLTQLYHRLCAIDEQNCSFDKLAWGIRGTKYLVEAADIAERIEESEMQSNIIHLKLNRCSRWPMCSILNRIISSKDSGFVSIVVWTALFSFYLAGVIMSGLYTISTEGLSFGGIIGIAIWPLAVVLFSTGLVEPNSLSDLRMTQQWAVIAVFVGTVTTLIFCHFAQLKTVQLSLENQVAKAAKTVEQHRESFKTANMNARNWI